MRAPADNAIRHVSILLRDLSFNERVRIPTKDARLIKKVLARIHNRVSILITPKRVINLFEPAH